MAAAPDTPHQGCERMRRRDVARQARSRRSESVVRSHATLPRATEHRTALVPHRDHWRGPYGSPFRLTHTDRFRSWGASASCGAPLKPTITSLPPHPEAQREIILQIARKRKCVKIPPDTGFTKTASAETILLTAAVCLLNSGSFIWAKRLMILPPQPIYHASHDRMLCRLPGDHVPRLSPCG
jgi:hypothetical protein